MGFFQRISGFFSRVVDRVKRVFQPPKREPPKAVEPKREPPKAVEPIPELKPVGPTLKSKLKTDSMGRISYRIARKEYLKPYNYVVKLKFQHGTQYVTVTSRRELTTDNIFRQAKNMASDPNYSFGALEEIVIEEAYLNVGAVLK